MATAQIIVTYEFEVQDGSYIDMYDEAITTPWIVENAIQADVHIYDKDWNEVNEDE